MYFSIENPFHKTGVQKLGEVFPEMISKLSGKNPTNLHDTNILSMNHRQAASILQIRLQKTNRNSPPLGCPGTEVRINGLFHLRINGVYWGSDVVLTCDPNFELDIQTTHPGTAYDCAPKRYRAHFLCLLARAAFLGFVETILRHGSRKNFFL